ncbi:asparagine synthase C-terminal domain-containing protein [Candidatus Bathyarchaeota archaeon]|nr:asparagine synthase C-terminal domain-containing protein [Candidatus Bathyarchaeota archaeon]
MSDLTDEICFKLRRLLEDSVKRNLADGILLSGGLDTSILALIASRFISLRAFTAAFKGVPAPDVGYALLLAKNLGLKHLICYFDEGELYDVICAVVKTVKSFDPMEIRNSVAIYVALRMAKEEGLTTVMTGDGCDELFAGYDFLFNLKGEKLKLELEKLWTVMSFSSIRLAEAINIQVKLPYLDSPLKNFAMKLGTQYKVRSEKGQMWGKWILRKAFEGILPSEIVWRVKTPIEQGSGTTILPSLFNRNIPDGEFEEKRKRYLDEDKVTIRDKEQLFYYEVYRSIIGVPHPLNPRGRLCPQCNSNVDEKATYCRTCGAYPI